MRYTASIASRQFSIDNVDLGGGTATLDGRLVRFDLRPLRPGLFSLILDDQVYTVQAQSRKDIEEISIGVRSFRVVVEDERTILLRKLSLAEDEPGPVDVNAPMPGLVVRLHVQTGDRVKSSQRLLTIEAMKMENEIKSPGDGVVDQVFVHEREVVEKDARLLRLSRAPTDKN
jgi:biotin carboxyl carrier protein